MKTSMDRIIEKHQNKHNHKLPMRAFVNAHRLAREAKPVYLFTKDCNKTVALEDVTFGRIIMVESGAIKTLSPAATLGPCHGRDELFATANPSASKADMAIFELYLDMCAVLNTVPIVMFNGTECYVSNSKEGFELLVVNRGNGELRYG